MYQLGLIKQRQSAESSHSYPINSSRRKTYSCHTVSRGRAWDSPTLHRGRSSDLMWDRPRRGAWKCSCCTGGTSDMATYMHRGPGTRSLLVENRLSKLLNVPTSNIWKNTDTRNPVYVHVCIRVRAHIRTDGSTRPRVHGDVQDLRKHTQTSWGFSWKGRITSDFYFFILLYYLNFLPWIHLKFKIHAEPQFPWMPGGRDFFV